MASVADLQVWQNRWEAQERMIDTLMARYRPEMHGGTLSFPRQETLYYLAQSLRTFAESQYDFFYQGFLDGGTHSLEPSSEYSLDYVFGATLEQVAHDVEVVERAAEQRISDPLLRETLIRADQYAMEILQKAIDGGLVTAGTKVVTYLEKSPSIRLIPYASVVLIGIPITCTSTGAGDIVAEDHLSIAHEIGHYVFRQGKIGGERIETLLRRAVPRHPAWCYRWTEEIFADVFGCCVAGPVMARSCQARQSMYSTSKFVEDDAAHPLPALRPDIYAQVVRRTELDKGIDYESVDGMSKGLYDGWEEARKEHGGSKEFTPSEGDSLPIADAISVGATIDDKPVDRIISMIVALLKTNGIEMAWPVTPPQNDLTSLETELKGAKYQALGADPDLAVADGQTGLWIDHVKANSQDIGTLPAEVWEQILAANGWTSRWGDANPAFG